MQQLKFENNSIILPQLQSMKVPYRGKQQFHGLYDSKSVSTLQIKQQVSMSSQQSLPNINTVKESSINSNSAVQLPPSSKVFKRQPDSFVAYHSSLNPVSSKKNMKAQSLEPNKPKVQLADPNYLMQQHNLCKNENLQRLNKVEKLEDLINFKVKTIADKLKEQSQSMQVDSIMEEPLQENSIFLNQSTHFESNVYTNENTLNLFKSVCDPLLGSYRQPRLLNSHKNLERYEIPENLKELPKNFNKFIPIKNIIPKYEKVQKKVEIQETKEKFYKNENKKLEKAVNDKLESIEIKVKKSIEQKQNIDPQVMLKKYFDKYNGKSTTEKKSHLELNKQIYSTNFVSQKYQKLKFEGKLVFKELNDSVLDEPVNHQDFTEEVEEIDENQNQLQTGNFADFEALAEESEAVTDVQIGGDSSQDFFKNKVVRDSQKNLNELLNNELEFLDPQNNNSQVKPRYSQLKQFQSVKSSEGNQVYYVPYTKEQVKLAKQFYKLSSKKIYKPIKKRNSIDGTTTETFNIDHQSYEPETVDIKDEAVQVEPMKKTLVPKKQEIVFKNGKEQPEPEIKYKPIKAKKFITGQNMIKTSQNAKTAEVKVPMIELITNGLNNNSFENDGKPEDPYQKLRTNQALEMNHYETFELKQNKTTGYVQTFDKITGGQVSSRTLERPRIKSSTSDSHVSQMDSRGMLKNFITHSESLTNQMQQERPDSLNQLPHMKIESNRTNKPFLMKDLGHLIVISTDEPSLQSSNSIVNLNEQIKPFESLRAPVNKPTMRTKLVSNSQRKLGKVEGLSAFKGESIMHSSNFGKNQKNFDSLNPTTLRQESLRDPMKIKEKEIVDIKSKLESAVTGPLQQDSELLIQASNVPIHIIDIMKSKEKYLENINEGTSNEIFTGNSTSTLREVMPAMKDENTGNSISTMNEGLGSMNIINASLPQETELLHNFRQNDNLNTEFPTISNYKSPKKIEMTDDQQLLDQYIYSNLIQRQQWIPSRFKKFPRFGAQNKAVTNMDIFQHYEEQIKYVSLNQDVIDMLSKQQATPEMIEKNLSLINSRPSQQPSPRKVDEDPPSFDNEKEILILSRNQTISDATNYKSEYIFSTLNLKETPLVIINDNEIPESQPISQLQFNGQSRQFDPFIKVILTKQIDNQILTSNRTIKHLNNIFSDTQKVIHNRFKAPENNYKQIKSKKELYPIEEEIQIQPSNNQVHQINVENKDIKGKNEEEVTHSMSSEINFFVENNVYTPAVAQQSVLSMISTLNQVEQPKELVALPISVYDITGGLGNEEPGFGYRRTPYVISKSKYTQDPTPTERTLVNRQSQKTLTTIQSEVDTRSQEEQLDKVVDLANNARKNLHVSKTTEILPMAIDKSPKPSSPNTNKTIEITPTLDKSINARSSLGNSKSTMNMRNLQNNNSDILTDEQFVLENQNMTFYKEEIEKSKRDIILVKEVKIKPLTIQESQITSGEQSEADHSLVAIIDQGQPLKIIDQKDSEFVSNSYILSQKKFIAVGGQANTTNETMGILDSNRSISYQVEFPSIYKQGSKDFPVSIRIKNLQKDQSTSFHHHSNIDPISTRQASQSPFMQQDKGVDGYFAREDLKPEKVTNLINDMFGNEVKYEKRVLHRDDLIMTNALIFDMEKFGRVNVTKNEISKEPQQADEPWVTGSNIQVSEMKVLRKGLNPQPLRKK